MILPILWQNTLVICTLAFNAESPVMNSSCVKLTTYYLLSVGVDFNTGFRVKPPF